MDAKRDWGHARDYVEGMWRMLQKSKPKDYVLATGKTFSVRQFVEIAFKVLNIEIKWKGSNIDEIGYDSKTNKVLVKIDKDYYRPTEIDVLQGDFSKAEKELKWKPKTNLEQLVKIMVKADLEKLRKERN